MYHKITLCYNIDQFQLQFKEVEQAKVFRNLNFKFCTFLTYLHGQAS